ncbi:uncharacterized protein [Venturia canescens]|uniref:uncharacterized protein isoform X2 n=1 Tax=Venturia canescens TaxID=32260 RepID=UPI001C9BD48D|nr:uncharacterized protein LOC122409791 isoform X2 [Venturia canescens]
MQTFVKLAFCIILSYLFMTAVRARAWKDTEQLYCNVKGQVPTAHFDFTTLAAEERLIQDKEFGDRLRLSLCTPLKGLCNNVSGYRVCVTKGDTEIGLGSVSPDPMNVDNDKLEFVFGGPVCKGDEHYSVHVIMLCSNEPDHDNEPELIPRTNASDCTYHIVWKNKVVCGSDKTVDCTAIGSAGEHYNLSPLMMRSDNYVIPVMGKPESEIILNVCHSIVYNYNAKCHPHAGACWKERKVESYNWKNIGEVESPKFDNKTKALTLTYGKGPICMKRSKLDMETEITFICDHNATMSLPIYVGEINDCQHRLIWKTSAACSIESLTNQSRVTAGTCKVTDPVTNIENDLRELMHKDYRSKMNNDIEYSFQVCGSISDGSCANDAGGCIVNNKTSTGLANTNLMWRQGGPYLNYTNGADCGKGQRRYTLIGFFCGAERSTNGPTIIENDGCALIIHWNTPLVCQKQITCETEEGGIALHSLIKRTDNYMIKVNDTEFHINICRPLIPKPYLTCSHGSSACRVKPETDGKFSDETNLGYSDKNPFFDDKKNVILRYTGGSVCSEDKAKNISSNFTFLCNLTSGVGAPIYKYYDNCTYAFEWTTSIVCPTESGILEKNCTIFNPHSSQRMNLRALNKSIYSINQSGEEYKINLCSGKSDCHGSAICASGNGYGTTSTVIFDYNRNVINLKFSNGDQCQTGRYSSEVYFICDETAGVGEPRIIGGFPFIWVIMTSKTQNAYEACLQYVKTHILHAHNILLVMSDFERALRNAVLKAFPTALSTGCNTHHDRAIYKKARALHLQNLFRTNAEAKSFFKKLLALAYLPADHIANQFETIKNSLTPTVRRQLNPLCDYYARYWLGIVKPEGFSVYGLSCRTNNIVESYHSRLKHRIEARPGPWDFVCKLLKLQANVRSDIEHLKNNVPIGRHARYSTVFKQKKLIKAWRELHMLEITVNEFIEKAAALKGNIEIIMANHEDMQENDEAHEHELQETPSVNPLDPDFEREIFSEEPPRWLLDNSITFQENEQVMPIVIDDDSDASSLVSNANNEDVGNLLLGDEERRTFPQPNIIENQPIVIDDDSDASSLVFNANNEDVGNLLLGDEERRTFPQPNIIENQPIVIDDDSNASSLVFNANNEDVGNLSEEERRTFPQPNIIQNQPILIDDDSDASSLDRNANPLPRQRREEITPDPPTSSTTQALKKQKRNKRRKDMRRRAIVRRQDGSNSGNIELGQQLSTAGNRLQNMQNNVCKVCLLTSATHIYWPCGHCCCCSTCADILWNEYRERRCPICRTVASEAPRRVFQPEDF